MNNYLIKHSKNDNSFKFFVGGLLVIFGFATLSIYLGYAFLVFAFIIMFYSSGTEIDYSNDSVRTFYSIFNFKKGDWVGLSNYHSISLKKVLKGYRTYSRANTSSIENLSAIYEVYLMGSKQKDTILLFNTKNKAEALEFAHEMSGKINIEIKPYGKKNRREMINVF